VRDLVHVVPLLRAFADVAAVEAALQGSLDTAAKIRERVAQQPCGAVLNGFGECARGCAFLRHIPVSFASRLSLSRVLSFSRRVWLFREPKGLFRAPTVFFLDFRRAFWHQKPSGGLFREFCGEAPVASRTHMGFFAHHFVGFFATLWGGKNGRHRV
jgi:hypothetical protein